jgi:phosphatidylserine decarboxylase
LGIVGAVDDQPELHGAVAPGTARRLQIGDFHFDLRRSAHSMHALRVGRVALARGRGPASAIVAAMRWPFTPYGTTTLLACLAVCGLLAVLLGWLVTPHLAWLALLPALFVLNFFRDPERKAGGGEDQLVSPADGLVSDIVVLQDPALAAPAVRIGIFLNVFDVHVNRAPCAGRVTEVRRREGRCHDARDPRAVEGNRAATIVMARPDGRSLAVRQITGMIARRIVCPVVIGQFLGRGQRYGMIRFGSRTELVVPQADVQRVVAKVGDKVKGGQTLLVEMRPARAEAAAAPPAPPLASGRA